KFLKNDKENVLEVLKLDVYQDSEDPNLYYYAPPFHVRQYNQGATNPFFHPSRVKDYGYAEKLLYDRDNYIKEYNDKRRLELEKSIVKLEERIEKDKNDVDEFRRELKDAIEFGDAFLIEHSRRLYENAQKYYDESRQDLKETKEMLKNPG